MKVRNGFVSNSSSSSFIIGVKNFEGIKNENIPSWIAKLLDKVFSSVMNGEQIKTIEALDKYIMDQYGWGEDTLESVLDDDEYVKTQYDKMAMAIRNGYIAIKHNVDYSDQSLSEGFSSLPKEDQGEGIYLIDSDG